MLGIVLVAAVAIDALGRGKAAGQVRGRAVSAGPARPDVPTANGAGNPLSGAASPIYRMLLPASPVLLALGFGVFQPTVLTLENLVNIIQQTAFLFVLTGAQSIVLLTRGFDLSLGPSVSIIMSAPPSP